MCARFDSLGAWVIVQVKPLEEDKAGKRNAKALHIEHCLTTQLSKLPKAYTGTSAKEAAMLEYVHSWAAVFRSLYPYRRCVALSLLLQACTLLSWLCRPGSQLLL